jgi:hypothetical protein
MKWLRTLVVFDQGNLVASTDWKDAHASYIRSIQSIDHPEGSGRLTLRRKVRRPDGQFNRNGVKYLKNRFFEHLVEIEGWRYEDSLDFESADETPLLIDYPSMSPCREPITSRFGDFDFVAHARDGSRVAIEWETGNISSSHRSLNKLSIGLGTDRLDIGVLIVPSRGLYEHLTDRIGNIGELSPYISMWRDLGAAVHHGLLAISIVEQDALTDDPGIPYLPAGDDGRAREGRARRWR